MSFTRGWIPIFLLAGVILVPMPATAQTRTNTKELGKKLLKEAEQKRQEAARLRGKARAAQAAVDAAKRTMAQIDKELRGIQKEKTKLLGEIVWDIMNDPKIGDLARAKPQRVRMIPAIKEVLKKNPWLDPILEDILKGYK